jgi:hypothetical protein
MIGTDVDADMDVVDGRPESRGVAGIDRESRGSREGAGDGVIRNRRVPRTVGGGVGRSGTEEETHA